MFDQLMRDKVYASFVEQNREHIKVVLDVVLFCAKQDILLRGHRESEEALNRGILVCFQTMIWKFKRALTSMRR